MSREDGTPARDGGGRIIGHDFTPPADPRAVATLDTLSARVAALEAAAGGKGPAAPGIVP